MTDEPFAVYRIFDAEGVSLYVGCSDDPWGRCRRHSRRSDLYGRQIASVSVTYHESQEAALATEREEIARLQPELNIRSLRNTQRGSYGTMPEKIIALVAERGEVGASQVREALGRATSTAFHRLVEDGVLEVVAYRNNGFRTGRPPSTAGSSSRTSGPIRIATPCWRC